MNLVVDGHSETDGVFAGDGKLPPFVVFDVDRQTNIAGPFNTRKEANEHRREILAGKPPRLDGRALKEWITKLDKED